MSDLSSVRLNKYISEKAYCSRREADKFIENGNVMLNGKKGKLGDQVKPGDKVLLNGNLLEQIQEKSFILIALNKPVGITSTTETTTKGNIIDFVNHSDRVFPIGRLDKDSQGLILLTNNGDIVNKILRAGNNHEKEYVVTVDKPITDQFIEGMSKGVTMMGITTRKCLVRKETPYIFRIILTQGLNRQIRRMCEFFNYEVQKLERVRIMNITLKGLPVGDWRQLQDDELATLLKTIEKSTSEAKPKSAQPISPNKPKPKTKPNSPNNSKTNNSNTTNNKSYSRNKPASKNSKPGNKKHYR